MSQRFAASTSSVGQPVVSDPHSFNQPLEGDEGQSHAPAHSPAVRQQQRLRDTVRDEISSTEIADVGHIVFGGSHRLAGGQPIDSSSDTAVQSILRVHADEAMNAQLLQLGTKLASNQSVQQGILEELTRDWSMVASTEPASSSGGAAAVQDVQPGEERSEQQQLGGRRQSVRTPIKRQQDRSRQFAIATDDSHAHHSTGSDVKSPGSGGSSDVISPGGTANATNEPSPASRLSNASRLSANWSEASDEDFIKFTDDDELARSFSSLRRALSSNLAERHPAFAPVSEHLNDSGDLMSDDQSDNLTSASELNAEQNEASHYETISGYTLSGSHFDLRLPVTPIMSPMERQRSVSNYDAALSSLTPVHMPARHGSAGDIPAMQGGLGGSLMDDEDDADDSAVLRLVKWIQYKVFGINIPSSHSLRKRTMSERSNNNNDDEPLVVSSFDSQLYSNQQGTSALSSVRHSVAVYKKHAAARAKSMEDAFLNGSYVNIALGVAGILIALALCKRYSPVMYRKLLVLLRDKRLMPP